MVKATNDEQALLDSEKALERQAAAAEKSAAQQLKEMPKVQILIPDDPQNPKDKVVPIGFNGVIYTVPRGVLTEVPQAIAEIWNDSYIRTRAVNQRIENSTQQEIKVM
jgi:selenocysteine lyase/cysteine desulfurase